MSILRLQQQTNVKTKCQLKSYGLSGLSLFLGHPVYRKNERKMAIMNI